MTWKEQYLPTSRIRNSRVDEKRKEDEMNPDKRNPFESDYGRVIFSAACRRLHDKTQVFPLTSDDSIHSRLTHSLEVMNLGKSFAIDLIGKNEFYEKTGLDEVTILREIAPILQTACLVHDIGNPPFGHFGEEVFQDYFKKLFNGLRDCVLEKGRENPMASYIWNNINPEQKHELNAFLNDDRHPLDYTQFDGNAQGFRVLTKLQYAGDSYGLNLTESTLAASLKYPNCGKGDKNNEKIGCHKHGIFTTEGYCLGRIAETMQLKKNIDKGFVIRHPLAFLVEAADSICYLTMDVEDAHRKRWVSLHEVVNELISKDNYREDFKQTISELSKDIKDRKDTKLDWLYFRNIILSHMVGVAINNFVTYFDEIHAGTYNKELIEDGDDTANVLKNISRQRILSNNEIISLEVTGRSVIEGIFNAYLTLLFHEEKSFREKGKSLISNSILRTIIHEHIEQYRHNDRPNYDKEDDFQKSIAEEVEMKIAGFDVSGLSVEERFRLIRDFVSGMTDKFALNHYQKLSGQNL